MIEQFKEIGIREVVISGGKAILRKDFTEIIKRLINSRIRVNSVFSNGILLNDEILSFLKNCGSKVNLYISLDGLNIKSHNEIRNPKDLKQDRYFETTRKSIINSISKGLSTRINTIIHKHYADDLQLAVN